MSAAFVNAGKIYDVSGAQGQSATKGSPIGTGILPQALINTLADILAACINTPQTFNALGGIVYSPQCATLLGDGNVFVNNAGPGGLTEFSNSGAQLSGMYGFTGGGVLYNNTIQQGMAYGFGMAIDSSGDVWTSETTGQTNGFSLGDHALYEFIGIAAPVVIPLSRGLTNHTLATRP